MHSIRNLFGTHVLLAILSAQDLLALPAFQDASMFSFQPNWGNLGKRYTREEIVSVLNDAWTTEVIIGGQKMNLLVDTGSSDL